MKIALCLHGHFRIFDKCVENLFKHIIKPYKPDVFMMAWVDSMGFHQHPRESVDSHNHPGYNLLSPPVTTDYITWVLSLLRPIDVQLDHYYFYDQRFADMITKYNEFHHPSPHHRPRGTLSLNFTRHLVMAMKKNYEMNNNFKYDRVICTRYDIDHTMPVDLQMHNANLITLPNLHGYNVTSDVWASGPSHLLDAWGEQINGIEELIDAGTFNLGTHEWMKAWFEHKQIPWQNRNDLGIYTRR
jgi:hypothetical protein